MATSSAREARRRKITERGSERLALISGRTQTLSPISQSQPDLLSQSHPQNATHTLNEDKASLYTPPEPNHIPDETDIGVEAITSLPAQGTESRSPLLSSTDQRTSSVELVVESRTRKRFSFCPKQIGSAIAATERTRLLCSVVFSILVVLSGLGFPILGNGVVKSILSFRPLYLVLATNVTIVVVQLLENLGLENRVESRNREAGNGNDLTEQLGKTLEIGFLLQKVADAVFMDCAIYSVIVVCGLAFSQRF